MGHCGAVNSSIRWRRQPPPFRRVEVVRKELRTPRLVRITLAGPELEGFDMGLPAASVRLLLPGDELVIPHWDGNEFLHEDGTRPPIRTLTPLRYDPVAKELDVEVVLHDGAPLPTWAASVQAGGQVAVSGTGRGYEIDPVARSFVLAGDETAIPAISTLLPHLPGDAAVRVEVEVADPTARLELPAHPGATVGWHVAAPGAPAGEALVAAVVGKPLPSGARIWAAGEAAAVQRIRRHLFEERGVPRSQTNIRGYWKRGTPG